MIAFHGNSGHWGDNGIREDPEPYNRAYRIEWLKALEEADVNYMAVHTRGFGASKEGKPGEKFFRKDMKALAERIKASGVDPQKIIVTGESMGGALAAMLAEELTQQGLPPALLAPVAAYSDLTTRVLDRFPDMDGYIQLVLTHTMDTKDRISRLNRDKTSLSLMCIPRATGVIDSYRTGDLHAHAEGIDLHSSIHELTGGHVTWNARQVVANLMHDYHEHRARQTGFVGGQAR